jgi:hypothetical protein
MSGPVAAPCCETCTSWWRGGSLIATELVNPLPSDDRGACHRRAPVPILLAPGYVASLWPETAREALCDEWEEVEPDDPDEEEIEPPVAGGDVDVPIRSLAA